MEQPAQHPLLSAPRFILDWPAWAAWAAPVKMPLDLRRGLKKADVTKPDTWAGPRYAQEHVDRAARLRPPALPLSAGVGILVAPPIVFVDFDDLITEEDDVAPEWAGGFLQRAADMGAFTEWSGSGTGAHAFIRTSPQFPTLTRNRYTRSHGARAVGIEIYSGGRFAALTGFPYFPGARDELNSPADGDKLLTAFIAELGVQGAPILTQPLGPIHVPPASDLVKRLAADLATQSQLARAFADPQAAFADWAADRARRSLDDTASAWRFHLFTIASRECPQSPLPLYELFKPSTPELETLVSEWQEVSGYLRKPHRVYSDIQRAHALVQEEQRLLALQLGEPEPKRPATPPPARHVANQDLAASWVQLGLAMKTTKNSSTPVVGTANFIRLLTRHHHFSQWKIERNLLDGTTRVNRQPLPDTLATRFLEPVREILDMTSDPPVQGIRDSIEVVADDNAYDPLVEYLKALPPYKLDQPALLSTWLERIGATPDADISLYSRRILLGLVARAVKPGIKFDYVPVFEGPTGVGKSTLVSALVTPEYFAVLSQDLTSKDAKIALRGKWGLEMPEMAAFKKADDEARKAFFSTPSDSFRPPYGRASIDVKRRCVLFGTTEDHQYLTDWRGNRRYWPIHFGGQIDLEWFEQNRDRLFAEALYYYERGERIFDTAEEMKKPERQAALTERLMTPAWQVRLLDHLVSLPKPKPPREGEDGNSGIYTTQYIPNVQRVLDLPPDVQRMSDAQLARFMHRGGLVSYPISYRAGGAPKKLYAWAHPDLMKLTDEQRKAFLSLFPEVIPGGPPPTWVEARDVYLPAALQHLGYVE
jgi:hypothetical protein